MAACKEQDCDDGALYDDRSGRASVPPRVAGDASPTEPLGATSDDQSSLDTASLRIRDEPRPDPAEESARSTQAHRASPSNVPAAKVTLILLDRQQAARVAGAAPRRALLPRRPTFAWMCHGPDRATRARGHPSLSAPS